MDVVLRQLWSLCAVSFPAALTAYLLTGVLEIESKTRRLVVAWLLSVGFLVSETVIILLLFF